MIIWPHAKIQDVAKNLFRIIYSFNLIKKKKGVYITIRGESWTLSYYLFGRYGLCDSTLVYSMNKLGWNDDDDHNNNNNNNNNNMMMMMMMMMMIDKYLMPPL